MVRDMGLNKEDGMPPVVIAVAITGSVPRKKDNPAVPVTVAEQVESTHEAFEAVVSLAPRGRPPDGCGCRL